jgi:hypothetical protein
VELPLTERQQEHWELRQTGYLRPACASSIDQVTHAAENNGADHIPLEEVVRETQFDPTDLVQPFEMRLVELHLDAAQVVLDLL